MVPLFHVVIAPNTETLPCFDGIEGLYFVEEAIIISFATGQPTRVVIQFVGHWMAEHLKCFFIKEKMVSQILLEEVKKIAKDSSRPLKNFLLMLNYDGADFPLRTPLTREMRQEIVRKNHGIVPLFPLRIGA
jgi:hypothetical protein